MAPGIGYCKVDVSEPREVDALFANAPSHLGGINVLVNNAGITGPTVKVEDLSIEDWNRTIAVDLSGLFYCTRLAARTSRLLAAAVSSTSPPSPDGLALPYAVTTPRQSGASSASPRASP